ncbi:MAG TPA: glycosyltransferase family 1 protein [Anaerolineae bacterium]|nr:glycosyltransferase family 1 protein [Anaerolineae bacterium]
MIARIGLDYTSALNQRAGIGRYTRELVNALATTAPLDWAAHYRLFVAEARASFRAPRLGANFCWHPSRLTERNLHRLWFRLRLPLSIENWTGPLDLFHAPDFFLPPVKRSTRTLLTVHDLSFVREPESVMPGMARHLNTWVPRSVQRADHVIAVSESTRHDLIDLYQTPPEKISVLYHGVGAEFRPILDAARLATVRRKYSLPEPPLILSVGTVQPRKNYQRLLQAFAHVRPAASLVIAGGQGWYFDEILAEVRRLHLESRVRFLGFVDEADLPLLYNLATVFVYPSLYEGFGLPVLEAMACGVPVVASRRSALPEVVGAAGQLIDPVDIEGMAGALTELLADETLRRQLSAAGLGQAARFSWARTAEQLVSLYQSLLS